MTPQHRQTLRSLAKTLGFVWIACIAFTLLQQVAGLLTVEDFNLNPIGFLLIITVIFWLPWVLFAPFVALWSFRFPIRPEGWPLPVAAHALLLLVLALVHGLGVGLVYHYALGSEPAMAAYAPWQHAGHFLFGEDVLLFDTVVYAVFAATFNIRNFHQLVREQELQASKLNQHLAELRLQTLRMQIDPHFLFNALNAISVLIKKGENSRADEAIRLLSGFFRQTLESSGRHWVRLEEELDFVRQYVDIAKLRFGDSLRVTETYDPSVRKAMVPAMLLQPLVENAMAHGFGNKLGTCELSLSCRAEGDRLKLVIADNGVGGRFYADPSFEEGTGLANVRGRLEQMYGADGSFGLSSTPGEGTRITIDLPLDPGHGRVAV